jgi:hypothetical protein
MIEQVILLAILLVIGIIVWKIMGFLMLGAFLFAVFLAFNIGRKRFKYMKKGLIYEKRFNI